MRGKLQEEVAPALDEQELPHLEGEPQNDLVVGGPRGLEKLRHRPDGERGHGLVGLLRQEPRQQLGGDRAVAQGRGLRKGGQGQVPMRGRVEVLGRTPEEVAEERLRVLLLGKETLDGGDAQVVEARLAQERDEVVLLLPHARVAYREDPEQPQQLLPRGRRGERELAHPVTEETEGERALAVLLHVDDLGTEEQLEGVYVQLEGSEHLEHLAHLVPVVADQDPNDLVRRVVEGEAPGGAGQGEQGGARRHRVRAAGDAMLERGRLVGNRSGLGTGCAWWGRVGGHQY